MSGWEAANAAALQDLGERLGAGAPRTSRARPRNLRASRQRADRFDDPSGNTLEVFHGAPWSTVGSSVRTATSSSPASRVSGTSCSPPRRRESLHFYRDVLGFRLRDSMRLPPEFAGRPADGSPSGCVSSAATPATTASASCRPTPDWHRASDGRGREHRRRGPVYGPGDAAQGDDVGDVRQATSTTRCCPST